jgi:putative DNA primase/helicase
MMFSRVKQAMEDLDIPIRSAGHVTSVMELVSGEIIKPPYLVFHRQDKEFSLNFLNGTLDIDVNDRTMQFRKHNPTDFFTTQLQCDYVPGATAPVFMSYLDSVFINDEDREEKKQLLLEVWFRAMFKSLTLARQLECGVMLLGNGHNGKSVYTRAIETFLGEENVSNVEPEMMDSRFQQGHMAGKHANINHELAEGITLKDAALKRLISGESITVEEKNKPAYNTRSSALVLMGSNHLPHSRDHSDALTRRFRMIYFNRKISEEEKDVRLGAKIAKEFPGIVNAALAVGMELLQRGSHIQPASSVEAVSGWKRDCDIVHQFREDCLVVKPGLTESFPAIYEAFKTWATENHGGTRNVTGNSLSRRLRQDGAISRSPNKNAQRQVMFTGCKLITNAASYDIPNNVTLFKHQEAKA